MTDARDVVVDDPAGPRRRRVRRVAWLVVPVAVVTVGLLVVLATRPTAATRAVDSPLLGRPAPALAGSTIDGKAVRLSDLRGRWVLVNFFATWCVPCRREHPDLVRFAARHAVSGDAVVIGVIFDDGVDAVRQFRRANGGDWPMVTDSDGQIAVDFGVSGVPESFLISPRQIVAAKVLGGVHLEALDRLLTQAKARFRE